MAQFRDSHEQYGSKKLAPWLKEKYQAVKGDIREDLREAVELLSQQINRWGGIPYLEIEARLGFFDEDEDGGLTGPFDSDVDFANYNSIMETLRKDSDILEIKETNTTDYFLGGGCRLSIDSDKGSRLAVRKKVLEHSNFHYKNSPFDIRVSFSQEQPVDVSKCEAPKKSSVQRKKKRTSFYTNHWRYDLTRVEEMKEGIAVVKHQVEVEARLEKIPYVDYVYMADSLLLKIRKITNICEEPEEERSMEFLDNSKKFTSVEECMKGLTI